MVQQHSMKKSHTLTKAMTHRLRRASLPAEAIDEFKARLEKAGLVLPPQMVVAGDYDATLLRFLRARKFNQDLAFDMLAASLKWREHVGANSALSMPVDPKVIATCRACRPSTYVAFDAEERPIFLECLGRLDPVRIEQEGLTEEQLLSYHLREMEWMAQVLFAEASQRKGRTVDKVVTIIDAMGLRMSSFTGTAQRLFRAIMAMDSDNYPECAAAIYIVNNNAIFGAIWSMVKGFVDKGTRDKVHVVGSGKAMQKALMAHFAPEMLPRELGGTLDMEATRAQWLSKLDASLAAAQHAAAVPSGDSPKSGVLVSNGGVLGSSGGATCQATSSNGGAYATPALASRSSSLASARSVYFDAVEGSFTDVPSRHPGSPYHPGDSEAPNPSPRGSLNSVSPRHSTELSTIPNHNKGEAGHGAAATHEFNLAALREEEQQERGGGACAGCCVIS